MLPGVHEVFPGVDVVFPGLRGLLHPMGDCGKTSSGLGLFGDGLSSNEGSPALVPSFEFFGGLWGAYVRHMLTY